MDWRQALTPLDELIWSLIRFKCGSEQTSRFVSLSGCRPQVGDKDRLSSATWWLGWSTSSQLCIHFVITPHLTYSLTWLRKRYMRTFRNLLCELLSLCAFQQACQGMLNQRTPSIEHPRGVTLSNMCVSWGGLESKLLISSSNFENIDFPYSLATTADRERLLFKHGRLNIIPSHRTIRLYSGWSSLI